MTTQLTPFARKNLSKTQTIAGQIEHQITLQILRGDFAAGERLPSLRTLATSFGVTLPTLQRVLARLEGMGLVEARHGSGVQVLDSSAHSNLNLLPIWFEASLDSPDESIRYLRDFLDLRRILASHLMARQRHMLQPFVEHLLPAVQDLVALNADLDERVEVDLSLTGSLLTMADNVAAHSIFGAMDRLIREVPWVAEALYGDIDHYVATASEVLRAIDSGDRTEERVRNALQQWDEAAVARFEQLLSTHHVKA